MENIQSRQEPFSLFQNSIETWANSYSTEGKNINKLEADLKGAITIAANLAIPLSEPTSKEYTDHSYCDDRVAELHHRINITKKNFLRYPSDTNHLILRH